MTADFHIPLCHHTYPGNQPDGPTFAGLTDELIDRHRRIAGQQVESVTLIFDKGNCSRENLQAVEDSPYHFISSLVPTYHPELLEIPARRFRSLAADGLPGVSAYRTTKEVFGVERTVVVTYNEALFVAQSRTLLREIAKRQHQLGELQARLVRHQTGEVRGGQPPTMAGTRKTIDGWLKARHMKELFEVDLTEHEGLPVLTYRFRDGGVAGLATDAAGQDDPVHRPGELERRGDRAGLSGPAPGGVGVSLPEEPAPCESAPATPLDRSEDPGACVLLRAGLAAVQLAAAGTAPPGDRALDPGVAGGARPDPRGGHPDLGWGEGEPPRLEMTLSRLTEDNAGSTTPWISGDTRRRRSYEKAPLSPYRETVFEINVVNSG